MSDRLAKAYIKKQGNVTWCLAMIVKNEAKNMVRLFESIKDVIDFVSIDDTGSTDDTKAIIRNWCKKNKKPLSLFDQPFVDFEYNRNMAVKHAQESFPQATYIFLSDADFVWKIKDPSRKKELYQVSYFINQILYDDENTTEETSSLVYPNKRLLRNNLEWTCECLSHEAWYCDRNHIDEVLDWIHIDDKLDGGARADKFERDERLIRKGLSGGATGRKKNRYLFYLGQTLRDLGRFDEGYEYYKLRSVAGGDVAEQTISMFQMGVCMERLGYTYKEVAFLMEKDTLDEMDIKYIQKWNPNSYPVEILRFLAFHSLEKAIKHYLATYQHDKNYIDSLYHGVVLLRHVKRFDEAYEMGKKLVSEKSTHKKMNHFSDAGIYNHRRYIEFAIVCFEVGKIKEGTFYLGLVLKMTNLPKYDDYILGFVNDAYIAYKNKDFHEIPRLTWLENEKPLKPSMLPKEER